MEDADKIVLRRATVDGVLWLTKVDPSRSNGLSLAMVGALEQALDSCGDVRALVIDAADGFHGPAVLVTEMAEDPATLGTDDYQRIVAIGRQLGDRIASLPIPVIGIVRAGALGGGLELLMRADFLFCTDRSRFKLPEAAFGFVAAWGGSQWSSRQMPFRRAQELLLLARTFGGREAEEAGLVTRSFAADEALDAHVEETLARLRCISPAAFRETKRSLAARWDGPLAHGLAVEADCQMRSMVSGDFVEGMAAAASRSDYDFVAKRVVTRRSPA